MVVVMRVHQIATPTGGSQQLFLPSSGICSRKTIKSIKKCLQDKGKLMLKPDKKPWHLNSLSS